MFVFFAPNAGALLGVPYPALAAWIGRSKPLAGDDLSRLLRSLPLTGLGGPVGVCLVLPFMFHCTRLDGDGVWDHDYALAFMRRNVNMSDEFIQFEVNRYLGWPGQAPSYKVGQRIWEQLRDTVAEQQGDAFDIKAFHKRALDIGGVGLDTLRAALLT
mgnify:CR=1 FL=1